MRIFFTGGGTAGHILPIIALTREIKRLGLDVEFFYLGPKDKFGSILLSQEGIRIKRVLAGKIRRYWGVKSVLQNIFDILFKMPLGFIQSTFFIFFLAPDLIFSKGGYGSLSTVFCAWIFHVPIFLHESDVVPGLVNRFTSKFASEIFVSFSVSQTEYFSAKEMISFGNPIRKEILEGTEQEAEKLFGLVGGKPVILVLGGSQGAQKINDMILAILPEILSGFELIHQTGEENLKQVEAEAKVVASQELRKYYHPIGFLKEIELKQAYRATSLVVSRAGSGSIFEIAACQKPSILIPLSTAAQNHQLKNAYIYAESEAALVIEETNLTPRFFLEKVRYLFSHFQELQKMAKAAKNFSRPEAAKDIAQHIVNHLTKG